MQHLEMTTLAQLAQAERWETAAMHASKRHLLIWVTRGQGRVTMEGITRNYSAHTAIWVPAHLIHGYELPKGVAGHAVHVPEGYVPGLPARGLVLRVTDAAERREVVDMVDGVWREASATPIQPAALRQRVEMVAGWMRRRSGDRVPQERASERLSRRYAQLVQERYHMGLRVADYASELGVTPTHLSRACKAASGQPAARLLQERVISEARSRLAETDAPVGEIASELGYASHSYFTRDFQYRTGLTPTQFRRRA